VGADVIAQHQDSPGPQEAAQERGAYSVGYNSDMSGLRAQGAPDVGRLELDALLQEDRQDVQNGTWKTPPTGGA
jgi:basic membrane protein A and related proteins